jgi:hypothetical protein
VLYEPGGTLSHVCFPTTAIVSLLYVMQNGESAEIAVMGNDGVVGVSLFMGGYSTSSRALVQSAGGAYRLTAQLMKVEFDRGGPVLHLFLRYTSTDHAASVMRWSRRSTTDCYRTNWRPRAPVLNDFSRPLRFET